MEIQIKYTVSKVDFSKLKAPLQSGLKRVIAQENHFFDGTSDELRLQGAVFRLRVLPESSEVTIKESAPVDSGSTLRWTETAFLSNEQAGEALRDPDVMLTMQGPLFESLRSKYQVQALKRLGGFKNSREVYEWNAECPLLHLDSTEYPSGVVYEIEMSDSGCLPITDFQEKLIELFESLQLSYSPSTKTKYQTYLAAV
eukprot:RCo049433